MKVAKAYCGFFDSTQEKSYQYTEADLARYTDTMVASGVRDADSLRVTTADDGLKVQLGYGSAMVGGHYYALEDDGGGAQTLTLRAAVSKPRIDRVIVRLNSADGVRSVAPAVLEGAEADMPLAPALTRAGTIYEISLAQVYIQVGASVITPDMVKDERADGEVCGILRALTEAQTRAMVEPVRALAQSASVRATGAHYWAIGPLAVEAGTEGWTRDEENDRYYQDFAVEGMSASLLPFVTCTRVGGAFPLCGCAGLNGVIRIYMTDVPEVADVLTVYALDVRADA